MSDRTQNLLPATVNAPPEFDALITTLIEQSEQLAEFLVEFVAASPATCVPALLTASSRGIGVTDRLDLRIILCSCAESPKDRLKAFRLAFAGLKQAGLVDDTIQHFRRGYLWSHASLVSCFSEAYPDHTGDVRQIVLKLGDIDRRLTDARDSISYAAARLRGEA